MKERDLMDLIDVRPECEELVGALAELVSGEDEKCFVCDEDLDTDDGIFGGKENGYAHVDCWEEVQNDIK